MKKLYLPFFLLLSICCISPTLAQSVVPVPYYPMVNWDSSPYKSFRFTSPSSSADWMNFRLLFPNGYDSTAVDNKKYPIILMLHGAGESARMDWSTRQSYPSGDPRIDNNDNQLLWGGREHLSAVQNNRFPGFVLFPQNFYGTWVSGKGEANSALHKDLQRALQIVDYLVTKLKIDPSRIYVHGLSNGGSATWYASYTRPDLFAAALPMSAPGDPAMANNLKDIPLWVFQGETDTNPRPAITLQTVEAVRNAGGTVRYLEYSATGHNTWNRAYREPDFFEWMLSQRKVGGEPTPNIPPTVNAGTDKAITLPVSTASFTATASDADGTISSWLWEKVSGPTATLSGSGTATLNLSNLLQGSYVFKITVTDNSGAKAADEVLLTVNPASGGNQLPVVNAGTDKSITLPVNTASFTATASDADGTISSWLWEKVSGPTATFSGSGTATLNLSNLLQGSYVFKVTVTDNSGAKAADDVLLTVNPAAGGTSCQALAFNGSNKLSLNGPVVLSGDFTIEYWAKLSAGISNADAPLSGGINQFINYYNAQARIYSKGATGGQDPITSSYKTQADAWTHYAFVRQGNQMKVYINGLEDTGATATNQWTGDFIIDNFGQGYNSFLNGQLDEVRLWRVAKSSTAIAENYNKGVSASASGLAAYYTFDEQSGVVTDKTGNGYNSQSLPAGISRTSATAPLNCDGGEPTPNIPPTVNAGTDKAITLPVSTASFTATASEPMAPSAAGCGRK